MKEKIMTPIAAATARHRSLSSDQRRHMEVISAPLATVTDIRQAPSLRRKREVLRALPPADHRRPVSPRVSANHPAGKAVRCTVSVRQVANTSYTRAPRQEMRARHLPASEPRKSVIDVRRPFLIGSLITVLSIAAFAIGLLLQPAVYSGPTTVHAVVSGDSVWALAAQLILTAH